MLVNETEKIFSRPKKYEYRVLVVGRHEKPHHVYCEYREMNSVEWVPFDPTYPHNEFGKHLFHPGFRTVHYESDFT